MKAWIVADVSHALLIDTLRSEQEAAEVAEIIAASGKMLWMMVVTHGHPDHYIGRKDSEGALSAGAQR
jgi:glyoxylase-like metal-dependent hydrolase (beta-lactamase superfamily II)